MELFGFLVAEVRTVAELADTRGPTERGVFTEVEPGARVAAAPYRSDRVGDRRPRPGAPLRRAHPRGADRALGLDDDTLDALEADGVIHSSGDVDTARPAGSDGLRTTA